MRFFKPELYVQLNSPDDSIADAAEEALDKAGAAYNAYWSSIKSQLPESIVTFAESASLHDADVFAPVTLTDESDLGQKGDLLIVAQLKNTLSPEFRDHLAFLRYRNCSSVVIDPAINEEIFNPSQPHWLYDEFEKLDDSCIRHQILLSDGRVVRVEFGRFTWQTAPMASSTGSLFGHGQNGAEHSEAGEIRTERIS